MADADDDDADDAGSDLCFCSAGFVRRGRSLSSFSSSPARFCWEMNLLRYCDMSPADTKPELKEKGKGR